MTRSEIIADLRGNQNPMAGTNGQIIVIGAFRYALGRMTYVPSATVEWLREHWGLVDANSRFVILRDTVEALQDGHCGADFDTRMWLEFAQWVSDGMSADCRERVMLAVSNNKKPWPLMGG